MLSLELSNKIIERLISVLDKDINIIGIDGIIIASSNKSRISEFHEGGRICAISNRNVIITNKNKNLFRGCRPGINLPIFYDNKVIGVVGITSDQENISSYGPIIKQLVELIIHENHNKELDIDKNLKKTNLFKELIDGIEVTEIEKYEYKLKSLENDINEKNIIVFGKEVNINNDKTPKNEQYNRKLNNIFKYVLSQCNGVYFQIYNDGIVFLFPYKEDVNKYLLEIQNMIRKQGLKPFKFIIGEKCMKLVDYEKNYKRISKVLNFIIEEGIDSITSVNDYKNQLLIDSCSDLDKEIYLEDYKEIFIDRTKKNIEILKTIKIYFENNMIISQTAKVMYVHRNTVSYRLSKFKDKYNIDIVKPFECAKLYIAILINEVV